MTRLFSGKSNTMPVHVPSPKSAPPPPPPKATAAAKTVPPVDLTGIDLGIESTQKRFDSMTSKCTKSSKPNELISDMSRLIDVNDNNDVDDDDNDVNGNNNAQVSASADYDFLNNW